MKKLPMFLAIVIAAVMTAAIPAWAEGPEDEASPLAALGESVPVAELGNESGGQAASLEELYLMLGDVDMEGEIGNNLLINTKSGSNYLGGNAFADSSGLNTVFQVTGSMNILQSSYIINVTIGD